MIQPLKPDRALEAAINTLTIRSFAITALILAFVGLTLFLPASQRASAGSLVVNLETDAVDADQNDGVCDIDLGTDGLQCTLRAAVQQANADAGLDTISLPAGTFTLTITGSDDNASKGDLDVSDDVSIEGAAATFIQAGDSAEAGIDRVFHIDQGVNVSLSDLVVQHGNADGERGGAIWNLGQLTLADVSISSNTAEEGGGIFNEFGSLNAVDTTFNDNEAGVDGGAVYNESGSTSLERVLVNDNRAGSNGAGVNSESNGHTLLVIDSSFVFNVVETFNGGAIDAEGANGTLTVVGTEIANNDTGSNGGGIYVAHGTSLDISGSTVSDNTAGDNGGGLYSFNGASFTVAQTTIKSNTAGLNGGGVFYGGGSGAVSIAESTISGNEAGSQGGGIFSWRDASLLNTTISGNTAATDGGGIYVRMVATVTSSTITGNTADSDLNSTGNGGGVFVEAGAVQTATLSKTIVAGNSEQVDDPDCFGEITSQGYNLIQEASDGCDVSGDLTGNILDDDPLLGPLADNDGPTHTHALLPGSPAIDAVATGCPPPLNDQRGMLRPFGPACDIGSFEVHPDPGPDVIWGDSDCSGGVTARDNQALLRDILSQSPLSQTEPCPDLGSEIQSGDQELTWGDWDCNGALSARDNQAVLRLVLGQNALSQTEPCPDVGAPLP